MTYAESSDLGDNFENSTPNKTINGTTGADSIKNSGAVVKIYAQDGNDTINNSANLVTISAGEGNDSVTNFGSNVEISLDGGDDYVSVSDGSDIKIYGGAGNDSIYNNHRNYSSNVTIYGGADNDYIFNRIKDVFISGDSGNDIISNSYADNVTINGGEGKDKIWNSGDNGVTINGGAGDDTIYNDGNNLTINGGTGNDVIELSTYEYHSNNINIQYTEGDGYDTITGFDSDDVLQITTSKSFETMTGGNDYYFVFDNGSITLKDVPFISYSNVIVSYEVPSEPKTGGGTSSNAYIYRGGDATISAATSSGTSSVSNSYEQINFATELSSFDVSGDNIYLHSNSGTLTVQNARGSYMKYADSSGVASAYSYIGVSGSSNSSVGNYYNTIDLRSRDSNYGVLIGGDNVNDSIVAGAGGSSMWGGVGGHDTLVGGDGYDEFVYKFGGGNDVIQNASSTDVVNLEGISLENIISANVSDSEISANFSDGGSIKIQGNSDVGVKIQGWTFVANRSTGSWYVK